MCVIICSIQMYLGIKIYLNIQNKQLYPGVSMLVKYISTLGTRETLHLLRIFTSHLSELLMVQTSRRQAGRQTGRTCTIKQTIKSFINQQVNCKQRRCTAPLHQFIPSHYSKSLHNVLLFGQIFSSLEWVIKLKTRTNRVVMSGGHGQCCALCWLANVEMQE